MSTADGRDVIYQSRREQSIEVRAPSATIALAPVGAAALIADFLEVSIVNAGGVGGVHAQARALHVPNEN